MSVPIAVRRSIPNKPAPVVPPLEAGDHLTRVEFERRYAAMPWLKKAELIDGVVYVPSPVSNDHSSPHFRLIGWLSRYEEATPGVEGGDNATIRFDDANEPQPDALLRLRPECGGRSRVDDEDYLTGPPELVAEVAKSSASYDLHSKLRAYCRHGVREYIVWRVLDEEIDWFYLHNRKYLRLRKSREGIYKSQILPGLWLDAEAMVRCDKRKVKVVAELGLASTAHVRHAARLRKRLSDEDKHA